MSQSYDGYIHYKQHKKEMDNWKQIKKSSVNDLVEARKMLHQAVQIVSAFPRNILPEDPTDESASLEWNENIGGLQSNPLPLNQIRVGLDIKKFDLLLIGEGEIKEQLPLNNLSVEEGLLWISDQANELGLDGSKINLSLPYEIEKYDFSKSLIPDYSAIEVFSSLFGNANLVLQRITKSWENSKDIRCWPHHFDITTLIPLSHDDDGELTKSIGVGLSPGDDAISEPYFYVNIWPNVEYDSLASHPLANGYWNKEGWSGAVLLYSDFVAKDQQQIIEAFINQAIDLLNK